MSHVIKAVLHNPSHPEYGQITIPFPIPLDEYDQTIEMLQAIELGFSINRDSMVDDVESPYKPLALLKNTMVNVDQLDYLAKRLAGFCAEETSQFQAMAYHLNLCDIKDLINLTFCCQKATVITDFSDLEKIGHSHYIHLCGGSDVTEDLEYLDGEETAYLLIGSGSGVITPFGVVYDNGMTLEQVYNGRQFPSYPYDSRLMVLEVTPKRGLPEGKNPEYLYLPAAENQIERTLVRVGVTSPHEAQVRLVFDELPEELAEALDLEQLAGGDLPGLNRLCRAIEPMNDTDTEKLNAAVLMAKAPDIVFLCRLAENLEQFVSTPGVQTPEKHGRHMTREFGHSGQGVLHLTLTTAESWYYLTLPASEEKLEDAKRNLDVEDFDQAMIAGVKYTALHLDRLIPTDCITVDGAIALAQCLREMEQEDNGLTKLLAILTAEQPDTFTQALNIAMNRDNYELVPEKAEEYGKQVLRRAGAGDGLIAAIDGYMDFAQLGSDSLAEDSVRRTEFGLVRRMSEPFPPQKFGQTMG